MTLILFLCICQTYTANVTSIYKSGVGVLFLGSFLEWAFGDASVLMDDGQISRLLLFHCITT